MKRTAFFAALLVAAWTIQGTLARFPGSSLRFDFILLLVIYLGFSGGWIAGGWAVLLIGIATETMAAALRGPLAISYLLVFFSVQGARTRFLFEGPATRAVWVMALVTVQQLTVSLLAGGEPGIVGILGTALAESLLSLLVFPALERWERLIRQEV